MLGRRTHEDPAGVRGGWSRDSLFLIGELLVMRRQGSARAFEIVPSRRISLEQLDNARQEIGCPF